MDNDAAKAWRAATRQRLLAERAAMSPPDHGQRSQRVLDRLASHYGHLWQGEVGAYWPIRAEISVQPFLDQVFEAGGSAALPVVIRRGAALQFRGWKPGDAMSTGVYGIQFPTAVSVVTPDVLLIAIVGFDAACYRLGYGGGYYDRTLASLSHKTFTIGVSFDAARLETIYPQPHDIALDAIVTESAIFHRPDPG